MASPPGESSPLTSPVKPNVASPSTSPSQGVNAASPATSSFQDVNSPATSPLCSDSSSQSPSSSPEGPPRKRKKDLANMSRTSLLKRLYQETSDVDSGSDDEFHEEAHQNLDKTEVPFDDSYVEPGEANSPDRLAHADPTVINSDSDSSSSENQETSSDDSGDDGNVPDNVSVVESSPDNSFDDVASSENADRLSTSDNQSIVSYEDDSLYAGSDISRTEAILKVLKLYIAERWTKSSLDANIKLMKSLLPKPNFLPSSGKSLLSNLNQLSAFQVEVEHFYCLNCLLSKKTESEVCKCKCEKTGVFYEFSIEEQLKYMFENRGLASAIDQYRNRTTKDGYICDIQDGCEFKKVRSMLRGLYDIVLLLNSDGVNLSTSSKQELWAILSVVCDVHPSRRSSYILVSGVFVDRVKPNMNTFHKPFVESMKSIYDKGGITWVHPDTKELVTSQVVCPMLCADAPAKAIMLNVKYFSHRFGCNVCEQKAEKIRLTQEEMDAEQETQQTNSKRKKQRKRKKATLRRFVFQDKAATLRTGARMNLLGELAKIRGKSRKGVIGQSVMSDLPLFDRGLAICAEYLHTVCLGVVKYFLNIMFHVRGPWYIGDHIEDIDKFLLSVKVPDFIKRLPRGLRDLKFLKGSELRALLIFFSLPAFKPYLPDEYFQHWMLLVGGIYILLQESISEADLNAADIMLRCFVRDIGKLYHKKFYTYNVHNLLHLPLLVKRWGNLWATGAFDFENFNGFITSHVHGTKHLGKELLNNIKIIQSTKVLERYLETKRPFLDGTQTQSGVEICCKELLVELSDKEKSCVSQSGITMFQLYDRIKINSVVYTARYYDQDKKRSNSFVQFCRKPGVYEYGEILYFVRDVHTQCLVCLISLFKIRHLDIFFLEESLYQMGHLLPVEASGNLIAVSVSCLVTKVILAGNYLCIRPNSYEVNL